MINLTKKTCFFVSPIGNDDSQERKNSDTVLNHFLNPICHANGFDVVRVDQLTHVDKIDNTIIEYLETAELVIVDLSFVKPNVFYEFGYRHALGLPLIPIISEGDDIPFDVSTLRTISYVTNDLNKVESIKNRLDQTIKSFDFDSIEPLEKKENNFDNSILLSIIDKLDELKLLITKKNTDEINLIAEQVAKHAKPKDDLDAVLMKTLMPEMLKNPDSLRQLMELSDMIKTDR